MRVSELPNWPPLPGGAYESGWRFPMAGETVVDELIPLWDHTVTFCGLYEGHLHSFHYQAASEKIALQVQTLVGENLGKTVAELGELEIEGETTVLS